MARLGVFGGSFDPPHLGHLALGQAALEGLRLARVLWMLTPAPPHKQGWNITPLAIRERMLLPMVARNERFELSRVEMERPGPHYMVDTLGELRRRLPSDELILLLGGDSLRDLPLWGRPQQLIELCRLGVMRRPGAEPDLSQLELVLPGIGARTEFFEAPRMDMSSSDIRRRVGGGDRVSSRDFHLRLGEPGRPSAGEPYPGGGFPEPLRDGEKAPDSLVRRPGREGGRGSGPASIHRERKWAHPPRGRKEKRRAPSRCRGAAAGLR